MSMTQMKGVKDLHSVGRLFKSTKAAAHHVDAHLLGTVSVPLKVCIIWYFVFSWPIEDYTHI